MEQLPTAIEELVAMINTPMASTEDFALSVMQVVDLLAGGEIESDDRAVAVGVGLRPH
jgi:hypothetical protein